MSATDPAKVRSPAERAEAARRRAGELQQRRAELAAGLPVTAQTAQVAQQRADESRERAEQAHRYATERHHDAYTALTCGRPPRMSRPRCWPATAPAKPTRTPPNGIGLRRCRT